MAIQMKATEQYFHDAVQGGSKLLRLWMKSFRVSFGAIDYAYQFGFCRSLSTNFTLASEISNK